MCSLAPSVLPGHGGRPTMPTTFAKGAPALWCGCSYGYGYDDADFVDALIRGIDAVVRPPNPADLPMPSREFRALSRRHRDHDGDFNARLRGIPSLRVPVPGQASITLDDAGDAATPKTPFAVLHGPLIYRGDDAAQGDADVTITPPSKKQCGAEYDADIDATFRAMETDPAERPSPEYLSDTQAGAMMMSDRAEIIKRIHHLCRYYDLAPGALHRAVSFVDRFLSAKKIDGGDRQLRLIGAAAVFAAAKYEDRTTLRRIDADAVAVYAGSTRREVLDAERQLVAALGYRLSGPTAYTFVDHFMRHSSKEDEEEEVIRALAHHLANMALLDYRCVAFLPSAVAASAIVLARLVVRGYSYSTPPCLVAGYAIGDLRECMEAIYDMHENLLVWPGCQQMMELWELTTQLRYSLPPQFLLRGVH